MARTIRGLDGLASPRAFISKLVFHSQHSRGQPEAGPPVTRHPLRITVHG